MGVGFGGVWVAFQNPGGPAFRGRVHGSGGMFILRLFLAQSREAVRGGPEAELHVRVCDPGGLSPGAGGGDAGPARAGSARRAGPGSEPGAVRGAGRRRRAPAAAVPGIFPQAERGVRDNPRGKCFSVIALKCSRSNSLQFPKHCQDHNLSPPDPPRFLQNCRLCSVFGPGRNSDAYHPAPLCSATISYKNPGPYASHPHASMQK